MAGKETNKKMLTYKGKPLVRSGNTIYYGDMADEYVAMLQILETKDFQGLEVSKKVTVQILSTNPELRLKERIKKKTEKNNLYDALKIASIWLERMLENPDGEIIE
ncbi:MAG TPA: hypothetical protein GX499_03250 [Clostridiales bacterium]|nr:hypothetical protein [Clostridiales bacterium]